MQEIPFDLNNGSDKMNKILFGIVGWNIAETTRMIEIAKIFKDEYECHFFSYGGQFEHLVEEEGFTLHHLEPFEDQKKIEHLWKVDRGETFKQPWTLEELKKRIQSETDLIDQLEPSFAFLGSVLTFSMSCKIKNIKLFNVIPLALSRPYLEAGLPVSPFFPKWINRIVTWIFLNIPLLVGNFRKVAKFYKIEKPRNALDVWSGDVNIVADNQEFSLLKKLPKNWYFSGPLFAHLDKKIPIEIEQILENSTKPKIYFAMGSSANRKVLLNCLKGFEGLDATVVAPIRSHLKPDDHIPSNVYVTDWLPALEVMKLVDIAVTHGGQGTVQTTVISGKPFLGIGMQPEQELNIYPFVVYGNALQLKKNKVTTKDVQKSIHMLLNQSSFKEKALSAKAILEQSNTYDIIKGIVKFNIN
jgi:UDP:flavonoid glycosyltransferase YjiC (YdhE family)